MNFVQELKWRGMIQDMTPGTEEQLQKEMTSAYLGIDPTADSLHIGHLVGVMMLRHFQLCGHKPIALIGGATGMIGDPSGKSKERVLIDEEKLRHNQEALKKQLARFLDFDSDAPNAAVLVNNYDWMKEFTFLDFIRNIGKMITVNYMMSKDSVKRRLSGEAGTDGMSFTEFTYQLLQGYDYVHLNETHGCKLQLGGADQWGNITTGTEMIRKMSGNEVFALTCPLITKADGKKFGKTEQGNIWLDKRYTSPYRFYQFWLNVSDEIGIYFTGIRLCYHIQAQITKPCAGSQYIHLLQGGFYKVRLLSVIVGNIRITVGQVTPAVTGGHQFLTDPALPFVKPHLYILILCSSNGRRHTGRTAANNSYDHGITSYHLL